MLDLLVWAFWFMLGAYSIWFFLQAKTFQPLTLDDLALTWKLHKRQTGCRAPRLQSLLIKDDEAVGFQCTCGYHFVQKRLITQKVRVYKPTSKVPLKSFKVAEPPKERKGSLQNADLKFSSVKEI